jgi:hypothetical protein
MKSRFTHRIAATVAVLLCACASAVLADTVVLDADDVTDWARVFSYGTWKQKDACLHPNSLLKFDLTQITDLHSVTDARLYLFVERVQPGVEIQLWHVNDDSWSYPYSEPVELWEWPVDELISQHVFTDTTSFSVDVTPHLLEEAAMGSSEFSIKITAPFPTYPPIRIASPLAPIERMRPRLVVEFFGPPAPPPIPDLATSPADIRLVPMRAVPGQAVTIDARVRNIGAAPVANVPVAFYEGSPSAGNPPIGIWIVPYLEAGGGDELTSVMWTASRGLNEIYVVVDPDAAIFETDETNNTALRTFLISDWEEYGQSRESFEYPGLLTWHSDFDVPKQFEYPGPKSFYINRSGGEAYHGENAMELYLDGTADDGTIWVETAVPVEPRTLLDVQVSFELFRYGPDMAFIPVASVGMIDPEMEGDFVYLDGESQEGWSLQSFRKTVFSGPYDMVHIAVGLTCTWETPGTFYIDMVQAQVTEIPGDADRGDGPPAGDRAQTRLLQSMPNPAGPLATIAYQLAQPGPVSLQVFDAAGRLLRTLEDGAREAGLHRVHWNGMDAAGNALPSGVYLYRLQTPDREESRKLLLAR